MRNKIMLSLGTGALTMLATAGQALAVGEGYDLAPVASPFTGQITSVLGVVLPIAGSLLALMVGWKIFKRFAKG